MGRKRCWRGVAVWSAAAMLAASCQGGRPTQRVILAPSPEKAPALPEVALPPDVDRAALEPLQGEALERAGLSLEQVAQSLPVPGYLRQVDRAPRDQGQQAPEPPLTVQRAYAAARQKIYEGQTYEAIEQLEQAARLWPEEPQLLALLGRLYTAVGNKVRGATYLQQAVSLNRSDGETLLLLGRFSLEQGRWEEAVQVFAHALGLDGGNPRNPQNPRKGQGADATWQESEDGHQQAPSRGSPPAVALLIRYYLAGALANAGYTQAAIEQYRQYLEQPKPHVGDSRHLRELMLLERQEGLTWQSVGDLCNRLGRPAEALAAYEKAQHADVPDPRELRARMIYCHLRLGQHAQARQLVVDQLAASGGDASGLRLVRYLVSQGVAAAPLAQHLTQIYQQQDRPAAMAIAIAELLPAQEAQALLSQHLQAHPDDEEVLRYLLTQRLLPTGPGASTDQYAQAIRVTAQAMEQAQEQAGDYAILMLRAAGNDPKLLEAFDTLSATERQQPMVRVLYGLALATGDQIEPALVELESALQADPNLLVTRLELVKLLVITGRLDRAAQLLEPLRDSHDPRVVLLQVRVLSETGQAAQALDLLDRVIASGSASTALILQKARLQVQSGDAAGAERTLLDALNHHPEEEAIYAALLELYEPSDGSPSPIADAQRQWSRLVRRLLGTVPNSRMGKLVRAQILEAQGQTAQAESLLRGLLAANENDLQALWQLMEIYLRTNRRNQAVQEMEARVAAHPDDRLTLALAHRFYQQIGDTPRMLATAEKLLRLDPLNAQRAQALAGVYLQMDRPKDAVRVLDEALRQEQVDDPAALLRLWWRAAVAMGRPQEAIQRLEAAMQRFPKQAADLGYELAMLVDLIGQKDRAEQLLLRNLERFPDHGPTNNALGYQWTLQGKNLDQAKAMIEKALENDPDNAAYLDSLGWVHYRLGQFDEATAWLQRARAAPGGNHPIIMDHLADALYQLGRKEEALRLWRQTLAQLKNEPTLPGDDPELQGLEQRISQKLTAVGAGQPPALAPHADPVPPMQIDGNDQDDPAVAAEPAVPAT
ncbi:MAG TPA: tetratricopeptide repeat protein, partial [Phycisphaeraceae bacterium]